MNETTSQTNLPVCPRCRSNSTALRAVSPVAGVWIVYGCDVCFYTWRSTEPETNTNPERYPEVFPLKQDDLPGLQVAPAIPALRKTTPNS
jgi:vanillate/4-hydroxybenzoate decarboxylase subunit D